MYVYHSFLVFCFFLLPYILTAHQRDVRLGLGLEFHVLGLATQGLGLELET